MKKTFLLITLLFVLGAANPIWSQMAKFKSLFLYNFAQNVGWPESSSQGSQFVISVVGDKEISAELETLAKLKKISGKTIVVKNYSKVKDIQDSDIIYLGSSKSNLMTLLDEAQKGKPVLIISSKDGLCNKGACISFILVDGKMRYQISPTNIAAHGLKVSGKLLALGIKVN